LISTNQNKQQKSPKKVVAFFCSEAAIAGDGIGERRVGSVHPGLVQSQGAHGATMDVYGGW